MKISVKLSEHPDLGPTGKWSATTSLKKESWDTAIFLCTFKSSRDEALQDIIRKAAAELAEPEVVEVDL